MSYEYERVRSAPNPGWPGEVMSTKCTFAPLSPTVLKSSCFEKRKVTLATLEKPSKSVDSVSA